MKNLKTLFLVLILVLVSTFGFGNVVDTLGLNLPTNDSFVVGQTMYRDLKPYSEDSGDSYTTEQVNEDSVTIFRDSILVYITVNRLSNSTKKIDIKTLSGVDIEENFQVQKEGFDTTLIIQKDDQIEFTLKSGSTKGLKVEVKYYRLFDNGSPLSVFDNGTPTVEFNLYPNPTTENLNFKFENYPNQVTYNLYNMSGQLVRTGELSNTLYVGDLDTGVYVINLMVDGVLTSKKFLKR